MKLISKLKNTSIVMIICSTIVGILFVAFPQQIQQYTALALGIALISVGIYAIVMYAFKKQSVLTLVLGILVTICGGVVCFRYEKIIEIIMLLLGIYILAAGIVNLIVGLKSIKYFRIASVVTIILSIVTIVFGFMSIVKYEDVSQTIIQLVGVALLVYAVVDLIAYVEIKKILDKAKDIISTRQNGDIEVQAKLLEDVDDK